MIEITHQELLEAGAHFGHLKRKWNPKMAPYIFTEKNNIHIIDLNKTIAKLEEAANAIKQIARSGKKILFVATKKQAKNVVAEHLQTVKMPYVTERWPGGMLTNFVTIRKAVKKMSQIDKILNDPNNNSINKKERLLLTREKAKLEKNLGSIADLTKLPAAIFIVDIIREKIALAEARKLNIPTFAIVDTNADPTLVDFPIPANDDTSKSISIIVKTMVKYIQEGIEERKLDKDKALMEHEHEEDKEIIDETLNRNIEVLEKSADIEEIVGVDTTQTISKIKKSTAIKGSSEIEAENTESATKKRKRITINKK